MAAANDVKSAKKLHLALMDFDARLDEQATDEVFQKSFYKLLRDLQHDMATMRHTPIVSMAAQTVQMRLVADRLRRENVAQN
jgi:hypothetical protein